MIEEKPYMDENKMIAWHFSHAKGRCVKGINILSCLVRYGDKVLHINELLSSKLFFCPVQSVKIINFSASII